jgi:hypothetical protein
MKTSVIALQIKDQPFKKDILLLMIYALLLLTFTSCASQKVTDRRELSDDAISWEIEPSVDKIEVEIPEVVLSYNSIPSPMKTRVD